MFAEGETLGSAKVYGGASGSVPLKADAGLVKVMVPKAGGEQLIARIVYQGPVPAPVQARPADRHAQGLARRQVGAGDAAARPPAASARAILPQRAFDAVTEMVIALFRAGAERL